MGRFGTFGQFVPWAEEGEVSCLDPQANSMPNFKYPSTGGVLEGEGKEWGKSENFEVFSPAHVKIINPTGSGFLGKHAVPSSMHGILVAISGTRLNEM